MYPALYAQFNGDLPLRRPYIINLTPVFSERSEMSRNCHPCGVQSQAQVLQRCLVIQYEPREPHSRHLRKAKKSGHGLLPPTKVVHIVHRRLTKFMNTCPNPHITLTSVWKRVCPTSCKRGGFATLCLSSRSRATLTSNNRPIDKSPIFGWSHFSYWMQERLQHNLQS